MTAIATHTVVDDTEVLVAVKVLHRLNQHTHIKKRDKKRVAAVLIRKFT
jgi:hypothetical protein